MRIEAPEKGSPDSFLDRKESGILHFVKYHGLGNDFILVIMHCSIFEYYFFYFSEEFGYVLSK